MSTKEAAPASAGAPHRGVDAGRAVALVVGSLLALLGVVVLVAGGTAAWFANQQVRHGYMRSATVTVSTPTAALVSEQMTLGGMRGVRFDEAGDVRISVRSGDGVPVFVGVAHAEDVAAYLTGTAHDQMTVEDDEPYGHHPRIAYHHADGALRSLPPPGDQRFWTVSAHGTGWQTMTWEPGDGDWVLVVANEDGSTGVHATTDVGMRTPMLGWVAPVVLGIGALVLGLGVLLIVIGARGRRGVAPA